MPRVDDVVFDGRAVIFTIGEMRVGIPYAQIKTKEEILATLRGIVSPTPLDEKVKEEMRTLNGVEITPI